ncbi:MAG: hypothetical protein R3B93_18275 [Bacteroidia bacterium]
MESKNIKLNLNEAENESLLFAYELPYEVLVMYLDEKLDDALKRVEEYIATHPERAGCTGE